MKSILFLIVASPAFAGGGGVAIQARQGCVVDQSALYQQQAAAFYGQQQLDPCAAQGLYQGSAAVGCQQGLQVQAQQYAVPQQQAISSYSQQQFAVPQQVYGQQFAQKQFVQRQQRQVVQRQVVVKQPVVVQQQRQVQRQVVVRQPVAVQRQILRQPVAVQRVGVVRRPVLNAAANIGVGVVRSLAFQAAVRNPFFGFNRGFGFGGGFF